MKQKKIHKAKKDNVNLKHWATNSKIHVYIIFIFAIVLYANTIFNDYTQDDAIVITDNMYTQKGIKGIPGLLTKDTFFGFFKKEGKDKLVSGGRYRPLTPITFAVENQFFENSPWFSHLINIILFGILCVVLYKVLLLLLVEKEFKKYQIILPFFAALIFLSHPIHTEAIANIKGRDEIFALLFSLLSVFYTLKWLKNRILNYQIYTFLFFILALFSKENAITFVAIIPLIILLFVNIKEKNYIKSMLPIFAATIIFLIVRTMILGLDFGGSSPELMNNPFLKLSGDNFIPFTLGERFATIIFTLGKYIQLLIFPHPLTNDYYPRQISVMTFANWKVLLSLVLYVSMIIYAFISYKKHKIITFSILFYIITLSIVSNIVFPVGTNMSERFVFMPSVGFALLFGYFFCVLYQKQKTLSIALLSVVLLLFSFKTVSRNTVWKNNYTLFTTDVKVSSNSAKALNAAGGSLVDAATKEKNETKKRKMLIQSLDYLKTALKIHPKYKNALLISGNANYFLGNFDESIEFFEKTLSLAPNFDDARKNLGVAYRDAGKYYGEKENNISKALFYLKKGFEMNPDEYETVRLYGVANAMAGNKQQAIELFTKCIKLEPELAGAYKNLGNAYYNSGDLENGKKYHDKARQLDPKVFD